MPGGAPLALGVEPGRPKIRSFGAEEINVRSLVGEIQGAGRPSGGIARENGFSVVVFHQIAIGLVR